MGNALRHIVLWLGLVIVLAPFVWMISTSLKPANEIFSTNISLLPHKWFAVENYREAFTKVPLLRYLLNGLIVTGGIFALQLLVSLPCAYALAKLRFRGSDILFAMVLVGLMIPAQAPAIPRYVMLYQVGLLDTYAALILPFTFSAFGIFLMRQFFKSIPDDLMHAARLDGLGEFEILWRIMLPQALPAMLAFGVISIVTHWNDFFWPLIVIQTGDLATPPLGTLFFRNEEAGSDFGPLMAGTVVITAPLVLLFFAAQRRFIEGVTLSGMKG
ncbi:MAG: carbohydrate ABC transporter permease [Rubrivivax sp.]